MCILKHSEECLATLKSQTYLKSISNRMPFQYSMWPLLMIIERLGFLTAQPAGFFFFNKACDTEIFIPCVQSFKTFLCQHYSDSAHKYSEADIINMLAFLIDTIGIFVLFGNKVFQMPVGFFMGIVLLYQMTSFYSLWRPNLLL